MSMEATAGEHIEMDQESISPQRGPVYALFTANIISYVGSRLTLLAIPWFVLQTTGSIMQMGITAFVSTLPLVISAFLGGVIIDRLGFKRASVLSDIVSGICVGVIPLLADTVGLAFWQLLVLVFLGGLLNTPGQTARSALVPDLATKAKIRLERANAIADGVSRVSNFIGAPLAALLIVWIGTKNLLWLDAASFLISAVLIGWQVPATRAIIAGVAGETRYFRQLGEGVRFIFSDSVLLAIIVSVMVTNLLDQALSAVVAPAYVQQIFHSPLPLGWIFGVMGGTAFVG
ncbi:MAG TPA: MFS transporter, partial [Ktedonobacteraceae bacterium]